MLLEACTLPDGFLTAGFDRPGPRAVRRVSNRGPFAPVSAARLSNDAHHWLGFEIGAPLQDYATT